MVISTIDVDASFPEDVQGVGMVPAAQGEEWVNLLNSGHSVVVNMVDPASANQTVYHPKNTATGGLLAPPSSWGLS